MERNSSTFSSKLQLPWAGLCAILIVLLNELLIFPWFLPSIAPAFGSRDLPMWQAKNLWLSQVSKAPQLVFLGDSKLLGGLDAGEFSANSGISSYNLALGGMQAPAQYFALKRLVERGYAPKAIFFSPSPYLLNDSISGEFSQRFVRWFISPTEFVELLPDLLALGRAAVAPIREFALRYILPSYSYRYELRALFKALVEGQLATNFGYFAEITSALAQQSGFRVWSELNTGKNYFESFPIAVEYEANPQSPRLFVFDPHQLNVKYVRKLLNLCHANDIDVLISIGPIPESLQRKRVEIGYQERFEAFLAELLADFPFVRVNGPVPIVFEDRLFWDTSHLSAEGAKRFTALVVDYVVANWSR